MQNRFPLTRAGTLAALAVITGAAVAVAYALPRPAVPLFYLSAIDSDGNESAIDAGLSGSDCIRELLNTESRFPGVFFLSCALDHAAAIGEAL